MLREPSVSNSFIRPFLGWWLIPEPGTMVRGQYSTAKHRPLAPSLDLRVRPPYQKSWNESKESVVTQRIIVMQLLTKENEYQELEMTRYVLQVQISQGTLQGWIIVP